MPGRDPHSRLVPRPDADPDRGRRLPWGDAAIAALAVLSGLATWSAAGQDGLGVLGPGLLRFGLLVLLAPTAAWTAVAGRHPSGPLALVAALAAVAGTAAVLWSPAEPGLAVVVVLVAAGLGRTRSWPLRAIGLAVLVAQGVLLLVVDVGL